MQTSLIAILVALAVFLMYDNSAKKTQLAGVQASVMALQDQLNNQQQAAQTAEISKLQQQVQQLTQQRDRAMQENQRMTAEYERLTRDAQQLAAQARPVPTPTPQNWLQKRIDEGPKLDNPATPVGPQPRYWVDRYGVYHYY